MPAERYNPGTGPKIPKSDQERRGQRGDRRTGRLFDDEGAEGQGRLFLVIMRPLIIIELDQSDERSLIDDVLPLLLFLIEMNRMGQQDEETPPTFEAPNGPGGPGSRP